MEMPRSSLEGAFGQVGCGTFRLGYGYLVLACLWIMEYKSVYLLPSFPFSGLLRGYCRRPEIKCEECDLAIPGTFSVRPDDFSLGPGIELSLLGPLRAPLSSCKDSIYPLDTAVLSFRTCSTPPLLLCGPPGPLSAAEGFHCT